MGSQRKTSLLGFPNEDEEETGKATPLSRLERSGGKEEVFQVVFFLNSFGLTKMAVGQKGYLKNPIGKRKNRAKPVVFSGVFFLTHGQIGFFLEQASYCQASERPRGFPPKPLNAEAPSGGCHLLLSRPTGGPP